MGPGEIVESIIEYGIYPVLMGILLWLLLAMQKRQNRAAEEQEKRLTALIDSSIKLAIHDSKNIAQQKRLRIVRLRLILNLS